MNTHHVRQRKTPVRALLPLLVWGTALLCGCSEENPLLQPEAGSDDFGSWMGVPGQEPAPPGGLVQVEFAGDDLTLWPYTGNDFSGETVDPINLVFVGNATPVQIRAALLSVSGDRSAFGFPPAPPFNSTWSDGTGGVQTAFSEGEEGWVGSVVQMQLGAYGPLRFHLRLFQIGEAFAPGGVWTLGAAHFEVLIPGTADHQVLSWERAEEIVGVDLLRSGLLDQAPPLPQSEQINQAPSYREIPAIIYNGLPEAIKQYIGGPPGNVSAPVPILTNGQATIAHLVRTAPITAGEFSETFSLTYEQIVPRPFCMEGPFDWVLVQGPVAFLKTVTLDAAGRYAYSSSAAGHLTVTPMDITVIPPVPAGPPFNANVSDTQQGSLTESSGAVMALVKRVAPQDGGAEFLMTRLRVASNGMKAFSSSTRCLSPDD